MDKSKIKTKTVCSANLFYLISGIIFAIIIVLLEVAAIRNFFVYSFEKAITLFFIYQLPVMFALLGTTTIAHWVHRTEFCLYWCRLKDGVDVEYIKENYTIESIDQNGILFVDKGNHHNFCVWELYQGYDLLYKTESMFT